MQNSIKKLAAISAVILSLSACSSVEKTAPEAQSDINLVGYTCDRDEHITVEFNTSKEQAVLTRNGKTAVLPQVRAASGFKYSTGRTTIQGKNEKLTVTIGRMAPLNCQADAQ